MSFQANNGALQHTVLPLEPFQPLLNGGQFSIGLLHFNLPLLCALLSNVYLLSVSPGVEYSLADYDWTVFVAHDEIHQYFKSLLAYWGYFYVLFGD